MLAQTPRDISREFAQEDGRPRLVGATADLAQFRATVVTAIVLSVLITWPMWGPRNYAAALRVADLPQVTLGPILIAASLLAVVAPRLGPIAVTVLVTYGMATDQTRMQPEFFSLPLLLWGSLPSAGARLVGRVSLISLWFFAGFHKFLSPDYLHDAGPQLVMSLPVSLAHGLVPFAVIGIPALEIGTAALAVMPATRSMAAWSALVLHVGILFAFSSPIIAERPGKPRRLRERLDRLSFRE